jgi:hypothetical protein
VGGVFRVSGVYCSISILYPDFDDLWHQSFTRQLAWSDWTRFDYYASRIRALNIGISCAHGGGLSCSEEIVVDARALDAMKQFRKPLLRNLLQLGFSDDPNSMKIARFVFLPTITALHLDFVSDVFTTTEAATLFAAIKHNCPCIEHLEFCGVPKGLDLTLSQFVRGWGSLRKFTDHSGHCVTDEDLLHLASLPTLLNLNVILKNSPWLAFPQQSFVSLRDLTIRTYHIRTLINLLKSHRCLPMQSLQLDVTCLPRSITELTELLYIIGDHCAHLDLAHLDICATYTVADAFFYSDMLRPLLSFTNLTRADIDCTLSFAQIDNTFLEEMATAWPRLERLTLGLNSSRGRRSEVTLAGLVPLAQYCPNLKFFSLTFNACRIERPGRDFRNHQLHQLGVGFSSMLDADVTAVAEFLSDIFPNLTSICWSPTLKPEEGSRERWKQVAALLNRWRCEGEPQ